MGKFDGILICTDCDGTLTDKDGHLSDANAEAIRYFQSEGGRFTLATGRFPEHLNKYADKLKINAPVISLNGVLIFDTEKNQVLKTATMKTKQALKVVDYLNDNWPGIWEYWINYTDETSGCYKPMEDIFKYETIKVSDECKKQIDSMEGNKETRPQFAVMSDNLPEAMAKMVFVMPEDMLPAVRKDLREKFGDEFNFAASWANGLEMQDIESGKGMAVEFLKDYFEDVTTSVCVGDYDNDISMLKIADISYAVENATDEVKELSDRIAVKNDEDAIAWIISDIENKGLA
ncbi:MAG: Cof-type HAD-IIB family hydrolase [Lachnospiraceae bacterium]|nr:Cof-type HAD-IIB family hydrolase [Lachnospiraceae bacterium]